MGVSGVLKSPSIIVLLSISILIVVAAAAAAKSLQSCLTLP